MQGGDPDSDRQRVYRALPGLMDYCRKRPTPEREQRGPAAVMSLRGSVRSMLRTMDPDDCSSQKDFSETMMVAVKKSMLIEQREQHWKKKKNAKTIAEKTIAEKTISFWSLHSLMEMMRFSQPLREEIPTWSCTSSSPASVAASKNSKLLSHVVGTTRLRNARPSQCTEAQCEKCDMVIRIPDSFSTDLHPTTEIPVHSRVLRKATGNVWKIQRSGPPHDKTIAADSHLVMMAIQFTYTGRVGSCRKQGSQSLDWRCEDCAPLFLFAAAMGFTDLMVHLVENMDASCGWREKIACSMLLIFAEDSHLPGLDLSGVPTPFFDAKAFCREYSTLPEKEGTCMLKSCLRGVPLSVVGRIMPPDLSNISKIQFLELWSAANYSSIRETQDNLKNDIIQLVSNLQLPLDYVRNMLEGGSNLVSVCVETPTGQTFLQNKFKFLHICDEDTEVQGVSYNTDKTQPLSFQFACVPADATQEWPGPRLVAGLECFVISCRSFARAASFCGKKSGQQAAVDFSDLHAWNYSSDSYLIPVWCGSKRDEKPRTQLGRVLYALISDDPLEMLAAEDDDHYFDRQVCVVMEEDCLGSQGGGGSKVLDSWEISNSEDFADDMMWDALHLDSKCLLGWAPLHSGLCGGYCNPGTNGKLYVLPWSTNTPRITRNVFLSRPGCYSVISSSGANQQHWVVYTELSGQVLFIRVEESGTVRSNLAVRPDPSSLCAVPKERQELVILYRDVADVYFVLESPQQGEVPGIQLGYTVPLFPQAPPGSLAAACKSVVVCPFTLDMYVMDEQYTVHVVQRQSSCKQSTLDKFFQGDQATLNINPDLSTKWVRLYNAVRSRNEALFPVPMSAWCKGGVRRDPC